MSLPSPKQEFLRSEVADSLRKQLQAMVNDKQYNTQHRYVNGDEFIAKHMDYMSIYQSMNHDQYILNLKLKLKIGPVRLSVKKHG